MSVSRSSAPLLLCLSLAACSSDKKASDTTFHAGAGDAGGKQDSGASAYQPPAPDSCITDVTPGHQTLTCEGLSFELWTSDVCLTKACGLIVDVHGFGMNGALQGTHSHLPSIAPAQGYIVVNPSAPPPAGGGLPAWSNANDDQVFAVMNHVIDVWHVDKKRIHFDGYSMGGWMTWRFICKHADVIASAAPIAAGLQQGSSCPFTGTDTPSRQLPILYTHGENDGFVPFSQAITERDAVIAAWNLQESEVVASDTDYDWKRYTNADGAIFEFAEHTWETPFKLGVPLKGHCFPATSDFLGADYPNAFLVCQGAKYNWGEKVLQFFVDHPMP